MKKVTFKQFKKNLLYFEIPNKPKEWRNGQCLMNYLARVWPEEYKRMASVHYYDVTNIDCYYVDTLIPNSLNHLEKIWKTNYPN